MSFSCNMTIHLTPGNDYYAFFLYPYQDLEFTASIDHSGESKMQWWMIILLGVLIAIVAILGIIIAVATYLFRKTARGKGYGDLVSEDQTKIEPLNVREQIN